VPDERYGHRDGQAALARLEIDRRKRPVPRWAPAFSVFAGRSGARAHPVSGPASAHLLGANAEANEAGFATAQLLPVMAAHQQNELVAQYIMLIGDGLPWLIGFLAVCAIAALQATGGHTDDKDALVAAMHRVQFNGPRGPFRIDPKTNNVIQNIYIAEVEQSGDSVAAAVKDVIPNVQDAPNGCSL